MWVKIMTFLLKYKFVIEIAKAWWEKRKAQKAKQDRNKDINGF